MTARRRARSHGVAEAVSPAGGEEKPRQEKEEGERGRGEEKKRGKEGGREEGREGKRREGNQKLP